MKMKCRFGPPKQVDIPHKDGDWYTYREISVRECANCNRTIAEEFFKLHYDNIGECDG